MAQKGVAIFPSLVLGESVRRVATMTSNDDGGDDDHSAFDAVNCDSL